MFLSPIPTPVHFLSVYLFVSVPLPPLPLYVYPSVCPSPLLTPTLSTVFHSITPPDNSLLSHSVLPLLRLPYWSFQLYIYLNESLRCPDVIRSGCLGPKHQLSTYLPSFLPASVSPSISRSVRLVLSMPYWSPQLYISLKEVSFHPNIIPSG